MRYAVYYAPPPGGLLHDLGSQWLGHDAATGQEVAQPEVPGLVALTADARRYGFHATLKPPFALRPEHEPDDLARAVAGLAKAVPAFSVTLEVGLIDGFLALVPAEASRALAALAARCVEALDGFRAPAPQAEIDRRRAAGLTPRQDQHLLRWGYPYVFDDFRFHMTLSARLDAPAAEAVAAAAKAHFAPALATPVTIAALSLFEEQAPGAPLRLLAQFPLSPSSIEVPA